MSQGIRIAIQLSLFSILFTWFIAPLILRPVAEPSAFPVEMSFLKIRIFGLPFLFLFQVGNAFLIATLNSRFLIIGFLFEAGLNILFDYMLIFGHWGMPAMGFNGAALASVIAEAAGMTVVFSVIGFTGLKRKYELLQSFQFDKVINLEVLKVAIPLILQFLISCSTWFVFYLLIESKGAMAKAVSNTMRNVFGIAGVFIWAFAGTSNTMVSNLIGQGKEKIVILAIRKITMWSFGLCSIIVVLLNIFPEAFFQLFGQKDDFMATGIEVIRVVSVGMLLMSISNIWLNGVTGTGNTKVNLVIEIVAITLYLFYTFYFMKFHYISLAMAWSNELVYWSVILLMSMVFLLSNKWKKRRN
jgi:Na+-driven multidrug efflux pump